MKRQFFGTDGIRGRAGVHPITPEFTEKLGRAATHILAANTTSQSRPTIAIGRDTRGSGPQIEEALATGIAAAGCDVILLDVLPTPGVATYVEDHGLTAGAVISASHNPAHDNGIKFFSGAGCKLSDDIEVEIEREINAPTAPRITQGTIKTASEATTGYIDHVLRSLPANFNLHGLRVTVDCANGASFEATPNALRRLGADIQVFHATPDGQNINLHCGSMVPHEIKRLVQETSAHVGLAHDGDADRVLLCDEKGNTLDGDEILALAALELLRRGELAHETLVATVMSNLALDEIIENAGGRVIRTAVGDRYVMEAMRAGGFTLGGEQSGHIIFARYGLCGDGLLAALQILRILVESGKPLSELRQVLKKYPQAQRHLVVCSKPPLETLPEVCAAIRNAEAAIAPRGRVLVRYSGTESLLRILIEARAGTPIEHHADAIASCVQAAIGA